MGNKLYVGNLSFRVTSDDLQEYFGSAGPVESANVVMDRETGRSRGFGFVEMANQEDGEKAIAELNGTEQGGREIKVNEAKPREDRGGSGGGGGGVAIPVGAYIRKGDDLRFEPNIISLVAVGIPFVWVAGRALSRVIRALKR